jgi:hypothetical protein
MVILVTMVTTTIPIGKSLLTPQRSFSKSGVAVELVELVAAVHEEFLVDLVHMHGRNYQDPK